MRLRHSLNLIPSPWIAFTRRFNADLARFWNKVPRNGRLEVRLDLHYHKKAWNPFDMRDDALLDLGPHLIDLAQRMTWGEVLSVQTHILQRKRAELDMVLEPRGAR